MAKEALAFYKGKPLTTIFAVYDVADGKTVKREGIECKIKITPRAGGTSIMLIPTARGRKSAKYLEQKREYRDDWDFDLSSSDSFIFEVLPQIPGLVLK